MPNDTNQLDSVKIFPLQVQFLKDALIKIFQVNENAYDVVNQKIKSDKRMGSRDRRQFTERIYHMVRWWNLLEYLAEFDGKSNTTKAYEEMIFISFWLDQKSPQLDQLKIYEANLEKYSEKLAKAPSHLCHALPKWIDDLGIEQYQKEWSSIANALNEPANIVLRVNSNKTNSQRLLSQLKNDGIEAIVIGENALSITQGKNLRNHALYKKGFFEFQDYHSQLVGNFIAPQKFETVIDFCAGAGGKSIQLSNLMFSTGKIYATDSSLDRMHDLPRRIKRSGAKNIEIIEQHALLEKGAIADAVLLDLPCSGLGTLKRKPDIKWKISEEKLSEIIQLQRSIIKEAIPLLKSSGSLVLVTCSILKNESEEQVKWLLSEHPEFTLDSEQRLHPHIGGYDGFYMAKLSLTN